MATRSVLTYADALADSVRRTVPPPPESAEVSSQAAFVRALVDEVERSHPADRLVVSLREQLGDELTRLAGMLDPASVRDGADAEEPIDVLVVDDEEDALRAATAVLRALGYPCRVARSGEEALAAYREKPAAIVLSDWCMPGMSGVELCRALRATTPEPYVILASAFQDNARLLEGASGGADDFLRKPLQLDELEVRLCAASHLIRALRMVARVEGRLHAA